MPSLRRTRSGSYIACSRFGGRQHQRALKTRDPEAAKGALGAIVSRVYKLTAGDIQVPPSTDIIDFQQRETSRTIALHPDLEQILLAYQKKRPRGQHVICHSGCVSPLAVAEAHKRFQTVLRGARWERELPSGKKKIRTPGSSATPATSTAGTH